MDFEDVFELGGLGLLFGGLEIVGAALSIVLLLVFIAGIVAAFLWSDFGVLQSVTVLGLLVIATVLGGLGGIKLEQTRRRLADTHSIEITD
ncbi:MAG: hypothetical protein J07HQW1_01410 [Haloquadratum walsbyi J07HQW1]|uniref:Uncharacterized protein n=1 Tax=Haloquadratum walsbyi J07HQW1 TaxID=1238424 RepID=U1PGW9_9EURY|nr:MAG: hypothetical protein J07HQW1_01410 [Haloquadratum walsbyi J07HQW1]